uniref:Uncharacterized protein n=1 Tax=Dunaliella tertiolecta TaxID=3047 RepID=A0A7S3R4R2_DUNTE
MKDRRQKYAPKNRTWSHSNPGPPAISETGAMGRWGKSPIVPQDHKSHIAPQRIPRNSAENRVDSAGSYSVEPCKRQQLQFVCLSLLLWVKGRHCWQASTLNSSPPRTKT